MNNEEVLLRRFLSSSNKLLKNLHVKFLHSSFFWIFKHVDVFLKDTKLHEQYLHVIAVVFSLLDIAISLSWLSSLRIVHPNLIEVCLSKQNNNSLLRLEVGSHQLLLNGVWDCHLKDTEFYL